MTTDRGRQPSGIASRVAFVAIVCAALGGLVAAATAIVAVDRLISREAELRLRAATVTLAGELDEERERPLRELVREVLDDENDEIATSGIRLAVFERGQPIAGDSSVPRVVAGTCATVSGHDGRVRVCGRSYKKWVLAASQATDELQLYAIYALSLLGALGLGALCGALFSLYLTRWAVGPLQALADSLRGSRPWRQHVLELGSPSNVREVEEIRIVLAQRAREIESLLEQSARFASDAAHELRTPLTLMRTELELMLEDATPDAAALKRVIARAERLTELVNRLLILALPSGDLSAGFEAVALAEVAEDVVAELSREERERVRLEIENDGLVHGDAELLRSLVSNGVSNALKFAPESQVVVRVTLRESPDSPIPAVIALEVADSGPGIPPELRERVFEPFYRVRAGSAPGHGLGLALVGHIARVHGGHASFLDAASGARLEVLLPAWQSKA